jgi:hypothetical protein
MSAAASRSFAVATLAVFSLWLAGVARAQGSDWPAPLPAQASAQQATTHQAGLTAADATDAQPTNIFVSLRIDSPGDNGPVTQTATTAVAGDTANDAGTAQDAWQDWDSGGHTAEPAPQATAQESTTDQGAATTATATRPQPTNVVVSVRVNSPGDDGPVTQASTVAVAAQSTNTAATAQKAQQAQTGAGGVATAPTAPTPPAPGAVADRPADASAAPTAPAPASCVKVAPGTGATRIVITLGKSCRQVAPPKRAVAPKRATVVPKTHETPPVEAAPPAVAPAAPVVREASVSPAPPSPSPPSSPPRAAPKPRPAPPGPRPSLDPLAASTKVAALVAAAPVPPAGEAQYGVMLALLLAMLGAAAVWSHGGVRRYCFWRWR